MAMGKVALCAHRDCLANPVLLGLPDERFDGQGWLVTFDDAERARREISQDADVGEVWVAACEDIEPINLAATLKAARPDAIVCMLSDQGSGSLRSRTSTSGIDALLTRQAFVARYGSRKARAAEQQAALGHLAACGGGGATSGTAGCSRPALSGGAALGGDERPGSSPGRAPLARAKGLLIPVVGGSGGVGKSTVAVMAALACRSRGLRTALLDFDLQFGDTADLLGEEGAARLDELVAAPERVAALPSQPGKLTVVAPPAHIDGAEAVVEGAPALLEQLSGHFDVVVANTGAAWAEQHAVLLERAAKVLFLVDQRPGSLRACRHALDLCGRCGIATTPFQFVLNRCSKGSAYTSIDISCALGGARVSELRDGGAVVEELLAAGLAQELYGSGNPLVHSVNALLDTVVPGLAAQGVVPEGPARGPRLRLRGKRQRRASCL